MLDTGSKRPTITPRNILIGPTIYFNVNNESINISLQLNQFAEMVNPGVFLRLYPEQAHNTFWQRKDVNHFKISNPAELPPSIAVS